mmetsp:Transcript_15780/g.24024  ORF Transcript_15780/g.24024 Transcript_15780/m.24024 type:complete len:218 (-) Transcript_15780:180-833(-)
MCLALDNTHRINRNSHGQWIRTIQSIVPKSLLAPDTAVPGNIVKEFSLGSFRFGKLRHDVAWNTTTNRDFPIHHFDRPVAFGPSLKDNQGSLRVLKNVEFRLEIGRIPTARHGSAHVYESLELCGQRRIEFQCNCNICQGTQCNQRNLAHVVVDQIQQCQRRVFCRGWSVPCLWTQSLIAQSILSVNKGGIFRLVDQVGSTSSVDGNLRFAGCFQRC